MAEDVSPEGGADADTQQWHGWLARVGEDWWATVVAGVIVVLAVVDALPKIPW